MPVPPMLHAKYLALRRRLALALTGRFDPYPRPPDGVALSPSEAHFAAYDAAPLALSWRRAGGTDAAAWQAAARAKLAALIGFRPAEQTPEARHVTETELPGGLKRRSLYLAAAPGLDIPVHIVWDAEAAHARPVMICLHGTNAGVHLAWREVRMPADPLKIRIGADYAIQAAARGYVAVCIEQSCFGMRMERRLRHAQAGPCITASLHAILLGRSLLGERASDVSSVIGWLRAGGASDLLLDPARVFVMGNSAGGTTAVFAGALDEHIDGVLAGGCIGFIRDTIARRADPEGQNTVPGILGWLEFDDVVALCAPRPFLALAGRSDHIFPFAQAEAVVAAARDVYAALGAADAIAAVPGPGGHRFYPDIAWDAFEALPGVTAAPDAGG